MSKVRPMELALVKIKFHSSIRKCSFYHQLTEIKESLFIKRDKPSLNTEAVNGGVQGLFFNKVWKSLIKFFVKRKRFWYRCFPVNFVKFSEHLQTTASLNGNLHSQALFLFWFYWLIIQFHYILHNFSICLLLRWLFAVIVISAPKKKKKERKRIEKKLPCKV